MSEAQRTPPPLGPVQDRFGRYASLRAAQRALSPFPPNPGSLPEEERFQQAFARLRAVRAESAQGEPDLGPVDALLDAVASALRAILIDIRFSELRAVLPRMCEHHPTEVGALLELCLNSDHEEDELLATVEYLVTLLSAQTEGELRRVVRDPVSVVPGLEAFCQRVAPREPSQLESYLAVFDEATTSLGDPSSVDRVIRKMRGFKRELGWRAFAPELLRRIVAYNVAVWNRLELMLDAGRTVHEIEQLEPPPQAGDSHEDAEERDGGSEVADEPGAASAADAGPYAVLDQVADALGARLRGEPALASSVWQLVSAFDVSPIADYERQAFARDAAGDEPQLIRRIVAAGLLVRDEHLRSSCADLGIDLDLVRDERIAELDARAQSVIARSLADNDYQLAKRLADTKAKFLYASIEQRMRQRDPGTREVKADAPSKEIPFESELQVPASEARDRAKGKRQTRAPTPSGAAPATPRWRVALLTAVMLLASAGAGYTYIQIDGQATAKVLAPEVVHELSPHLASAYRNGFGFGPSFFGEVSESWTGLTEKQRYEEAIRLAQLLGASGVREAMLFDGRRRMQVHWANGQLFVPRAPGRKSGR